MPSDQRNGWCFTLNNPDGLLDLDECAASNSNVKYIIYSEEAGENGTVHLQGYIEFSRSVRLATCKGLAGLQRAHWEIRRGTRDQARDYCRKEDETHLSGPYEWGDFGRSRQGSRTDIKAFKEDIDKGASDLELWNNHPNLFLRYNKQIPIVRSLTQRKRQWKTEVHVLYGEPGCGKSLFCSQKPDTYWKPVDKWWDHYHGESTVVMDDFHGWIPYAQFLHLLDAYPLTVEYKGGTVEFLATTIFITTNSDPRTWYKNPHCQWPAIARRVNFWYFFSKYNPPLRYESWEEFWPLIDDTYQHLYST